MYFELLGNVPVLSIRREPLELRENRVLKRIFDIISSLIFLCTIFPFVYIIIGIAIKISSPGPIFFKQKRSGEDGREFWCYKFRSMRVNAQCDVLQATANDPRKTRIGEFIRKTSIDELPQLFNILKGDMSIVGNRPLPLYEAELLTSDAYIDRFMAPSGLTGLWQVEKRGGAGKMSEEERNQLDSKYARVFSAWLDLKIIFKTLTAFIQKENV